MTESSMAKGGEKRKDKFAVRLQIYSTPVPETEGNIQSGFGNIRPQISGMRLPAAFPCKG